MHIGWKKIFFKKETRDAVFREKKIESRKQRDPLGVFIQHRKEKNPTNQKEKKIVWGLEKLTALCLRTTIEQALNCSAIISETEFKFKVTFSC